MRDPRDARFVKTQQLMANGQMVGFDRPVTRITWAKPKVRTVTAERARVGKCRHLLFNDLDEDFDAHELYTFETVEIQRSIGNDAATCTITLPNVDYRTMRPEGQSIESFGRVGYLTPGRGDPILKGKSVYADMFGIQDDSGLKLGQGNDGFVHDWDYPTNKYRDALVPNTVLRTYQGYGSDNFDENGNERTNRDAGYVHPSNDTKLYKTGVWLIDKVTFTADGHITIECRDLAKLLIEQYIYPPMIPMSRFPLIYCPAHKATGHHEKVGRNTLRFHSSSVDPWYGWNASEYGHRGSDAFDSHPNTFWLSVSNAEQNAGYSFEWIQGKANGGLVNEVYLDLVGGNYYVYVSVMENGVWQGTETVPYVPNVPPAYPNGANIHYVKATTVGGGKVTIPLPRAYKAQYVRVCFTNLQNLGYSGYPYRAGVRTFSARNHVKDTFVPSTIGKPGYIRDWSEPIKELCAWAGFTWPDESPADPILGHSKSGKPLRVWGDFERLGAGPVVCTPADYFVSKSFMEGIRQIVDFIGGIFFIDEFGGANFRLPNIWNTGNFITDPEAKLGINAHIKAHPIEFHENANLVEYEVSIDDSQTRSEVLVIGGFPNVHKSEPIAGGVLLQDMGKEQPTSAIDFTDILAGQYRLFVVPGDSTKFFYTEKECQRMAELIGLFILFAYRKGTVTAPAHPGLQLDDQVRIFERTTYESNIHYVSGITTNFNAVTGQYTMQATTHWLGHNPNTHWFINKAQLTPAVKQLPAILKRMGKEAGGDTFEQTPFGT